MTPEQFWKTVDKTDSGCWLWSGYINRNGYGQQYWRDSPELGIVKYVHRFAWELTFGSPPSKELHHSCKVRHCVNPARLVEVTRKEHAFDWMRQKPRCGHSFDLVEYDQRRDWLVRRCRQCRNEYAKLRHRKMRAEKKGLTT